MIIQNRINPKSSSHKHLGLLVSVVFIIVQGTTNQFSISQSPNTTNTDSTSNTLEIHFGVIQPPVVAQQDITIRYATSNQQPQPKPLECSSIRWIGDRLLITSDRHNHVVFTCKINTQTMTIDQPIAHELIRNEQYLMMDIEALAVRQDQKKNWVAYAMCSLSNDKNAMLLPKRCHMMRFNITAGDPPKLKSPVVLDMVSLRQKINAHFKAVQVKTYKTYNSEWPDADKNTYRWGNIEGIDFTPQGTLMIGGMRNPLHDGRAIFFVVKAIEQVFNTQNAQALKLEDIFTLDLGRRGVSDLCWDPVTSGYLIVAAKSNGPKLSADQPFPPNTLDSAVFWWSGHKSDSPILIAKAPDMKLEAICRIGNTRYIALGSDEGDVSEGRTERQSVLTILDFTGVSKK